MIMQNDSQSELLIESDTPDDANLRGMRLQMDYLEPELQLRAGGVRHTVVVFGSTRIVEEQEARRRVDNLQQACSQHPEDARLEQQLRIAKSLQAKSRYYEIAREFGAIVGRAGGGPADCSLTLMTGGGPGIMEAANRGSSDVGAKTIGLNITLPNEQDVNRFVTPAFRFKLRYFAIRKLHFLLRARALVVFPGGYGTLDELFETLNLVATRIIRPLPVVLVGSAYWQRLVSFDALVAEGVIDATDRELFWYAETAQEVWDSIAAWYQRAGIPFHCPA